MIDQEEFWHVWSDGKQYGPCRFSILVEGVRKSVLEKHDQIWRPGWDSWRPANSVPGLFAPPELGTAVLHDKQDAAKTVPAIPASSKVGMATDVKIDADRLVRHQGCEPNPTSRSYLVRHWRGELSLPVSYWINGVLITLATIIAVLGGASFVEGVTAGAQAALLVVCVLIATSLLSAWQWVGIWRSASRYTQTGKKIWGGAAKAAVVFAILRSLAEFGTSYVPIVSEHIRIAMGDQKFGENRFRLLRNGTELEFSGGINVGTAKEFERMLEAASQVRVLHLNSHGGRVAEADLMAAKVRARRLVTYVSEECLSACTHIFLAGRERWVSERGKLGFHQPSFPGLDRETAAGVIEQERRDLLSMGLSSDFVSKALDTPNDKMWRPSHKELLAARAISGISDGSRFATSGYSASLSAAEREEALLKLPLFASLKRFEPETFRELMARVADGYSQGDSEEQIVATTRGLIAKSVRRKLPYASDTDVMQAVDLRIGYMEGLKSADPESCVALEDDSKGARLKVDLAKLYPALASKELALNQALIESKMFGTHSIPNDRQVEPYLEKVANRMTTRTGLRLGLLEKAKLEPAEYGPFCEVALAFYREVRRLPIGEATALMRNIYADASK